MRVLVLCEHSGVVRRAFAAVGCDAWSCDLLVSDDGSDKHIVADMFSVLDRGWDLVIAHPPCTYLSLSGMHWTVRGYRDENLTLEAMAVMRRLMCMDTEFGVKRFAIENPVGLFNTEVFPTQIVQPYQYGDDAAKRTCLWLKGLPKLVGTSYVSPRLVDGKKRWANQTDRGDARTSGWKKRSRTFEGIAAAMARQWAITDF